MPTDTIYVGAVRWDSVEQTIAREYQRMENGRHLNGWTLSAVTDAVCFQLRDLGFNILDIPTHCMEHDPRTAPLPAPPPPAPPAAPLVAIADILRASENGWEELPLTEREQITLLAAEVHRLRDGLRRLLPTDIDIHYARQMLPA